MNLTRKQLAALFSVSVRTITTWQSDPSFPQPKKSAGSANVYNGPAVVHWWRDREIASLIEGEDGQLLDLDQERARLARAQRLRVEQDMAVRRKELVEVAALRRALDGVAHDVRDGILAVPHRLAPIIAAETDADQVHEIMTTELRAALMQIADAEKALPDKQEAAETDEDSR